MCIWTYFHRFWCVCVYARAVVHSKHSNCHTFLFVVVLCFYSEIIFLYIWIKSSCVRMSEHIHGTHWIGTRQRRRKKQKTKKKTNSHYYVSKANRWFSHFASEYAFLPATACVPQMMQLFDTNRMRAWASIQQQKQQQ